MAELCKELVPGAQGFGFDSHAQQVTSTITYSVKVSIVTLVSKVDNRLALGDYRPISILSCLFKFNGKLIAEQVIAYSKNHLDIVVFALHN